MRSLACVCVAALGLASTLAAQGGGPQFDVASIKRNTSERRTAAPPASPYRGQFVVSFATIRSLVALAYSDPLPVDIVGLPAWAASEHYDIVARGKPAASDDEITAMWRALLADRLKLQVHYEQRPLPGYKLVLARADGRLGPQLKPATCTRPDPGMGYIEKQNAADRARLAVMREQRPPTSDEAGAMMAMCSMITAGNTLYGAGLPIEALGTYLRFVTGVERQVVDATGLKGTYNFILTYARVSNGPLSPDGPPSVLGALQEQLGLKLESTSVDSTVLVVDHIERPTDN